MAVAKSGSRVHTLIDAPTYTPYVERLTPIQKFYHGESIFITGGTGFIGKLLIEKLLRGCPSISCIYVLIRTKKEKNVLQRMEEIVEDSVSSLFTINYYFNFIIIFSFNSKILCFH